MINFSSIEPDAYYAFGSDDINVNNILGSGNSREELRRKYPNAQRILKGSTVRNYGIEEDDSWGLGKKLAVGAGLALAGLGAYKLANMKLDDHYEIDDAGHSNKAINRYYDTPIAKAKRALGIYPTFPEPKKYKTQEDAEDELRRKGLKQIGKDFWTKSGSRFDTSNEEITQQQIQQQEIVQQPIQQQEIIQQPIQQQTTIQEQIKQEPEPRGVPGIPVHREEHIVSNVESPIKSMNKIGSGSHR